MRCNGYRDIGYSLSPTIPVMFGIQRQRRVRLLIKPMKCGDMASLQLGISAGVFAAYG
jgi:hypothetical protein